MCSKFVVVYSRCAAPALSGGQQRQRVRRGRLRRLDHRRLEAERVPVRLVAPRPAPCGGKRNDRFRAAARGELKRDVAAERVAGDVRRLEAGLVHRPLDRVGEHGVAHLPFDRRPTRVAGERGRQDIVTALERGQNELPDAPRVGEAVEANQWRTGAAAMSRSEGRVQARADSARSRVDGPW